MPPVPPKSIAYLPVYIMSAPAVGPGHSQKCLNLDAGRTSLSICASVTDKNEHLMTLSKPYQDIHFEISFSVYTCI
jgi:hypothetical protein